MFGAKKPAGENVLLLDIENASVGVGLTHIAPNAAPILYIENRIHLDMPRTVQSTSIAKQIEKATQAALQHIALAAARFRAHEKTAHKGVFTKTAVFLGAPWGTPNLLLGKPTFIPSIQKFITDELATIAPTTQLRFYTGADAAVFGTNKHKTQTTLLVLVRGELTELVLISPQGVVGYGTLPVGARSLYRTLTTHAGLSLHEARSALALMSKNTNPYHESFNAAGHYIVEQFAAGVEALAHNGIPDGVVVVAEEPLAEWFARNLEHDESLGALFAPGSTVRAFGATHAARYLGGYSAKPDLHLTLAALFGNGTPLVSVSSV